MSLFLNKLKLNAAVHSMHQFCAIVRLVFPVGVDDGFVEAATVFLYRRLAEGVFGRRFTNKLMSMLDRQYKFATPVEVDGHLYKIARHIEIFEKQTVAATTVDSGQAEFTRHVTVVVKALLAEAGFDPDDAELVRQVFPRFEDAVRRIKKHLTGIKQQSHFVLKR